MCLALETLLEKVKGYIDIGESEGAKLVVDDRGFKMQGYEKGYYLGGTLFDNVATNMKIYKEEILSIPKSTWRMSCRAG